MRKVIYLFLPVVVIFMFSCTQKEGFKKELSEGSLKVVITSDQPPHVGINRWKLKIYEDGKAVTDAVVKINGYMPPMPGMPEMSMDYPVKKSGDYYVSDVNLSMGGTWQITIFIERDGKTEKLKFGFNL
ncbi:MAG: FixH family protein [Persephonella sp.]|nr:FixH family protein [Persephonella sp.]